MANERELARRRHEYFANQVKGKADSFEQPMEDARVQAIAERRGSYRTAIACASGHQSRRFTSSGDCCACYDEWKQHQAVEANLTRLNANRQREPETYTRKGIGSLTPQVIPKA